MKFHLARKWKSRVQSQGNHTALPSPGAWGKVFPSHSKDPISCRLPTSAKQGVCSVPNMCLTASGLGIPATGDRGALRSLGKAANIVLFGVFLLGEQAVRVTLR